MKLFVWKSAMIMTLHLFYVLDYIYANLLFVIFCRFQKRNQEPHYVETFRLCIRYNKYKSTISSVESQKGVNAVQ